MGKLNFPASPSNGDTHTINGNTYTYIGDPGVWRATTFGDAPTGPAGTIGGDAAQDCVSENIESNTRRMQKAINQSAKGNMQVNSRIPEEEKTPWI